MYLLWLRPLHQNRQSERHPKTISPSNRFFENEYCVRYWDNSRQRRQLLPLSTLIERRRPGVYLERGRESGKSVHLHRRRRRRRRLHRLAFQYHQLEVVFAFLVVSGDINLIESICTDYSPLRLYFSPPDRINFKTHEVVCACVRVCLACTSSCFLLCFRKSCSIDFASSYWILPTP